MTMVLFKLAIDFKSSEFSLIRSPVNLEISSRTQPTPWAAVVGLPGPEPYQEYSAMEFQSSQPRKMIEDDSAITI